MGVSNTNNITIETIDEATPNEHLDNLILNAIKSIRNIRKTPGCSSIYGCRYVAKFNCCLF